MMFRIAIVCLRDEKALDVIAMLGHKYKPMKQQNLIEMQYYFDDYCEFAEAHNKVALLTDIEVYPAKYSPDTASYLMYK